MIKFWSLISVISFGVSAMTGGIVHQFYAHTGDYPGTPFGWHLFWRLTIVTLSLSSSSSFVVGCLLTRPAKTIFVNMVSITLLL